MKNPPKIKPFAENPRANTLFEIDFQYQNSEILRRCQIFLIKRPGLLIGY